MRHCARYHPPVLRILTLTTLYPHGARPNFGVFVEAQTLRLAARDDVDLRVVAPLGLPPFPLDRLSRYRALKDVPVEENWHGTLTYRPRFPLIPSLGWRFNAALVERAAKPLLSRLRDDGFAFDVIDAEFFYPCGVAAARLGRHFGVPVIIKARGSDIHYWGRFPRARRQILEAAAQADAIAAVSEALRRDMVSLGMDLRKIEVCYTGVDLDRFHPLDRAEAKARLDVNGPLVVSIGNLIPLKGHDLVIRAVARLHGVTLLIAGHGPEQERLASLIAELRVGDRVRLLGSVPHADIPALVGAADVLALASEREGLANVWVESLAAGTPVITSDVGGAREVIDTADAGMVVKERTPEAFATAIETLLARPPAQQDVRKSAKRFAWSRNTEAVFNRMAGLKQRA